MIILPCFIANDLVTLNSNDIYGGFVTDFSLMGVVILEVFLFSYSIEHHIGTYRLLTGLLTKFD